VSAVDATGVQTIGNNHNSYKPWAMVIWAWDTKYDVLSLSAVGHER